MNTRRKSKRPRKHGRKTRSRRQKGGDNEEYYTEELVEAIEAGDIDNVISTLEQGADVNTRTQDTPILLRSVLHGDVEIVKILLKQPDIDVNAQQGDNTGATALIKALRSLKYSQRYEKTIEIIKLLLKDKRTDVSIDTVYSTAFNAAMHNKAPQEIIDLIREREERKKNIAMARLVTEKAKIDTGKENPEDERDLVPVAKRDVATSISKFFGGKRKTRKNHRNLGGKKTKRNTRINNKTRKQKVKRNRRSQKRAGVGTPNSSLDEGRTDVESISFEPDEPFHAANIEPIALANEANEVHDLEMGLLDDSFASDLDGSIGDIYEYDASNGSIGSIGSIGDSYEYDASNASNASNDHEYDTSNDFSGIGGVGRRRRHKRTTIKKRNSNKKRKTRKHQKRRS